MKIIKLIYFKWFYLYEINIMEICRNGGEISGYLEDKRSNSVVVDMIWYDMFCNKSSDGCIICFKN